MIRSSASLKYRLLMNSRKWVRLWNKYLHFSIWVDPAFLRCGRFSGRTSKQTCQRSSLIRHVCVNQKQVCVRLVKMLQSSCPAASGRWKSGNLSCRPTTGSYQMVFLFARDVTETGVGGIKVLQICIWSTSTKSVVETEMHRCSGCLKECTSGRSDHKYKYEFLKKCKGLCWWERVESATDDTMKYN